MWVGKKLLHITIVKRGGGIESRSEKKIQKNQYIYI
jgi:hypothetical protein